jgi:hypothetical protein
MNRVKSIEVEVIFNILLENCVNGCRSLSWCLEACLYWEFLGDSAGVSVAGFVCYCS